MNLKAIFAVLALAAGIPASATTLYTNNFESNTNGFSGAGSLTGSQGYKTIGFGDQMLRNDTAGNPAGASILNLNFGDAVSDATLTFSFAAIDSWNGNGSVYGPDFFNILVDGKKLFSESFDYESSPNKSAKLTNLSYGKQLGFSYWPDQAYTMTLNLGDFSAGAHTIAFFASGDIWQAGDDESWAIDNVTLTGDHPVPATDVPEPVSGALLLAGLGAMALASRRG